MVITTRYQRVYVGSIPANRSNKSNKTEKSYGKKKEQGIKLWWFKKKVWRYRYCKQVVCRHIELPPMNRTFNPKETQKTTDIKGAIVRNYSSREAAEKVHGEGSFTNNYTEDDFLRP